MISQSSNCTAHNNPKSRISRLDWHVYLFYQWGFILVRFEPATSQLQYINLTTELFTIPVQDLVVDCPEEVFLQQIEEFPSNIGLHSDRERRVEPKNLALPHSITWWFCLSVVGHARVHVAA